MERDYRFVFNHDRFEYELQWEQKRVGESSSNVIHTDLKTSAALVNHITGPKFSLSGEVSDIKLESWPLRSGMLGVRVIVSSICRIRFIVCSHVWEKFEIDKQCYIHIPK